MVVDHWEFQPSVSVELGVHLLDEKGFFDPAPEPILLLGQNFETLWVDLLFLDQLIYYIDIAIIEAPQSVDLSHPSTLIRKSSCRSWMLYHSVTGRLSLREMQHFEFRK
jgi:hypothetical protein